MDYYNPYSKNRKKKVIRILTVVLSAVAIVALTVVFGNYLRTKAELSASSNSAGAGRDDGDVTEQGGEIIPSEPGDGCSVTVNGVCVPLRAPLPEDADEETEAPSFAERIGALEGKTAVLIPLCGEGGELTYASARVSEITRTTFDPSLPGMEELRADVAAAKELGLRTCALIDAGDFTSDGGDFAVLIDSKIAEDAAEAGFDEFIVSGAVASAESVDSDLSHAVLRYMNKLSAGIGNTSLGLCLPADVYRTSKLAPQIELFTSSCDFLCMEFDGAASTVLNVGDVCKNLAGTVSLYNMRFIISPAAAEDASGILSVLKSAKHVNCLVRTLPVTGVGGDEPANTDVPDEPDTPYVPDTPDEPVVPDVPDEPDETDAPATEPKETSAPVTTPKVTAASTTAAPEPPATTTAAPEPPATEAPAADDAPVEG